MTYGVAELARLFNLLAVIVALAPFVVCVLVVLVLAFLVSEALS